MHFKRTASCDSNTPNTRHQSSKSHHTTIYNADYEIMSWRCNAALGTNSLNGLLRRVIRFIRKIVSMTGNVNWPENSTAREIPAAPGGAAAGVQGRQRKAAQAAVICMWICTKYSQSLLKPKISAIPDNFNELPAICAGSLLYQPIYFTAPPPPPSLCRFPPTDAKSEHF